MAGQERSISRWSSSVLIALMSSALLLSTFHASAATFTVNTTDDIGDALVGDGLCWTGNYVAAGGGLGIRECSLRAAIQEADATAAADAVEFWSQLPVDIYGTIKFVVSTNLPSIDETITIDGTTAPTYDLNDPDAVPVVVLDGGILPNGISSGLFLQDNAHYSVIRGLAIVAFQDGINLFFVDHVLIQGNHLGLERGYIVRGNGSSGIALSGDSTTIGHTFDSAQGFIGSGNVISGNGGYGILMAGNNTRIAGNKIGTDRFGNAVLGAGGDYGNGYWGVTAFQRDNLQLGRIEMLDSGVRVASGNTIAGNKVSGVLFAGTSTNARVYANHIGIGSDGTTALGNGSGPGIVVDSDNVIIGEEGIGANVISGHQGDGILIETDYEPGVPEGIRIVGNLIGLNAAGDATVPNVGSGIAILEGDLSEISHNVIGGNTHGILVNGLSHEIHANYIGTNIKGQDLGNARDGITIREAFDTTVGSNVVTSIGQFDARKNVIAFNGQAGVSLPVPLEPSDPIGLFNAIRGNEMHSNGGLPIDLGVTGANGNDPEDDDSGRNRLQNSPQMDEAFTQLNVGTGEVEVRYLVDTEVTEAAYPIHVDFYQVAADGEEPLHWLGSDIYDASDATNDRDFVFMPAIGVSALDSIVAIATDDENNTSEVSPRVPVPEPGLVPALLCGALGLVAVRRPALKSGRDKSLFDVAL